MPVNMPTFSAGGSAGIDVTKAYQSGMGRAKATMDYREAIRAREMDAVTRAIMADLGAGKINPEETESFLMQTNPKAGMAMRKENRMQGTEARQQLTADRDAVKDAMTVTSEEAKGVETEEQWRLWNQRRLDRMMAMGKIPSGMPNTFQEFMAVKNVIIREAEELTQWQKDNEAYEETVKAYGPNSQQAQDALAVVQQQTHLQEGREFDHRKYMGENFDSAAVANYEETGDYPPESSRIKKARPVKQFMVEGVGPVLVYDNENYRDPDTGELVALPSDAILLGAETGAKEARLATSREWAQSELDAGDDIGGIDIRKAALGGTGPPAMIAAFVDRILGGAGIDEIFSPGGFFPETQENRQTLRIWVQTIKGTLRNSAGRFPKFEMELITEFLPDVDTFWKNPRTAVSDINMLFKHLEVERRLVLKSIVSGGLTDEATSDLVMKLSEIDRMVGSGASSIGGNEDFENEMRGLYD